MSNNSDSNNDATMIQHSAQRLFADAQDSALNESVEAGEFPTALWQQIEAAGFGVALVTGEQGFGLAADQALPIFEELGRHRVPAPLAETAIGCALLADAGQPLPEGPGTLIDSGPGVSLQLTEQGSGHTLSGQAQAVPWGRHAHWAVVQLADGPLVHVDLHSAGATLHCQNGLDIAGLPADTLRFEHTPVRAVLGTTALGMDAPLRTLGAAVHAAMLLGSMEWVLAQAIEYANDRVQFGRPIGKNQALQQMLAQTAGDVASARMAVRMAGQDLASGSAARAFFGTAAAKVRCGEAATRSAAVAHQVLGAIGFTREHALHFATRRLWAWRAAYGADAWWAQRLGEAAIRAGSPAFWPALTQREFAA